MARMSTYHVEGNETVTYLVSRGLRAAGLRQARDVKSANLIVTYFTAETDLEDAYFDSEGLVQLANPGTYLVDLSPSSPHFAQELYAVSSVSDLHFVAAPLVVLDPVAEEPFAPENLLILAGGETADVEAVTPALSELAEVRRAGDAGEAQLARAARTIAATAALVSAVETEALYRAVRESSLDFTSDLNHAAEVLPADATRAAVLAAIAERRFAGDYTVEMLMGEVGAALTAADDVELILPQLEAAMSLVELLSVISESQPAPAGLSLLFADEEEGKAEGLDWSRSRELFAREDDEYGYEDEDGHVHVHDHDHAHDHHDHDHAHEHYGLRGRAAGFDDFDFGDEPYGFDRFDIGRRPDDDED